MVAKIKKGMGRMMITPGLRPYFSTSGDTFMVKDPICPYVTEREVEGKIGQARMSGLGWLHFNMICRGVGGVPV